MKFLSKVSVQRQISVDRFSEAKEKAFSSFWILQYLNDTCNICEEKA